MSSGVERRSNIDTETVKGLMIINGGGAVALMSLLPSFLGRKGYEDFSNAILVGIIFFMLGLVLAVIHNHFRRRCSLFYERHQMKPPNGKLFGIRLWEPTDCFVSTVCMWSSIVSFLIGGANVAISGLCLSTV